MEKNLSAGEYWEWRTTISEMDVAKSNLKNAELEVKLLQRDTEIKSLQTKLHSVVFLGKAKEEMQKAITEYNRFKGVLEERHGVSLNNKMIDDVTYEIKEIPMEEPTKGE